MTKKELAAIRRRLERKLRSSAAIVLGEITVSTSDVAALLDRIKELELEIIRKHIDGSVSRWP